MNFMLYFYGLAIVLCLFVAGKLLYRPLASRWAPVKTVQAQVVDKFKDDKMARIYGSLSRRTTYTVVFQCPDKKRSFSVSEFSYRGYRVGESGTLRYQGFRLLDFH